MCADNNANSNSNSNNNSRNNLSSPHADRKKCKNRCIGNNDNDSNTEEKKAHDGGSGSGSGSTITTTTNNGSRKTTPTLKTSCAAASPRYRYRITTRLKWKIILPTIILLLWGPSHVQAIRKGRLMTPSTFTALSGDLHVQIQFTTSNTGSSSGGSGSDSGETTSAAESTPKRDIIAGHTAGTTTTTTTTATSTSTSSSRTAFNGGEGAAAGGVREVENIITSTLVISKYIDETIDTLEGNATDTALPGSTVISENEIFETTEGIVSLDEETATSTSTSSTATSFSTKSSGSRGIILQRRRKEIVQNIPVYPDPRNNVTQVAVPCQTFTRGGLYEMQVVTNLKTTTTTTTVGGRSPTSPASSSSFNSTSNEVTAAGPTTVQTTTTLVPVSDERLRQTLDVRWPSAEMHLSTERFLTYPDAAVEVELRFPEVNCERAWHSDADLPEFWLELIYCGKERSCTQLPPQNVSKSNILYAEQVRGYPKRKLLKLGCELFGLAGNYAVQLRPMVPAPGIPITRRFLSVDWSDKFVFNVYARSIFPCDPHTGIGVLYEYPGCILEQGDRVRVYAKLRADVASLKPPTSLHYVAEQRVVKSQYSLYFKCELFTEKYVEYCFVYVSQAISGAVADVRMDCVPTLPVSESDTGGWGPWSEWTPCSTNCLGGTRNRYRFCDSPPPRYGAKFCEGPFVETEKCGQQNIADTWDCIYETSYGNSNTLNNLQKANRTEVSQEIGPGCRCGCIVHLGAAKPKRYIAGATQSCPGRSFWLIQVDGVEIISLSLDFLRLPCATQYIKVRDGPSLSSTLLVELNGGSDSSVGTKRPTTSHMESTGAQLLVEFYAGGTDESGGDDRKAKSKANGGARGATAAAIDPACTGGFLANVEQLVKSNQTGTPRTLLAASTRLSPNAIKSRSLTAKVQRMRSGFTLVHISAVVFASIIILISAMLGAQYVVRYRKYHLAIARRRDEGSRLHTPRASLSSLHSPPSRAMSTTTLLSEVICLVKMRPRHQLRHSILRESVDAENLALRLEMHETGFNEEKSGEIGHITLNKCAEEIGSTGSIVTLRNELVPNNTPTRSVVAVPPPNSPSPSVREAGGGGGGGGGGFVSSDVDALSSPCGTLTRKDSAKDSESIISSGMSSICNSPPMNLKRLSKYSDRYDAVTLKIRNSHASTHHDSDMSLRSSLQQLSASLTNGCYSPAVSTVSTATIRTTNPKESKEKQNRKKLLARPGSEFSLGNQEELELDYYDYNVINAGAAPGSYLGMDPAYLIWIPPFDECTTNIDGDIDGDKTPEPINEEPDETIPLYEEIKMPKYGHYLSPGSNSESSSTANISTRTTTTAATTTTNTTTPTSDEISPLSSNLHSKVTTPCSDNYLKNSLIQQVISGGSAACNAGGGGGGGATSKPPTPYMSRKQKRAAKKQQSKSAHAIGHHHECIGLLELSATKSARNIATTTTAGAGARAKAGGRAGTTAATSTSTNSSSFNEQPMNVSYVEKETEVVKSPSGDLQNFLALDDIAYADESESNDFYEAVESKENISGKVLKNEIIKQKHEKKQQQQQQHNRENNIREVQV